MATKCIYQSLLLWIFAKKLEHHIPHRLLGPGIVLCIHLAEIECNSEKDIPAYDIVIDVLDIGFCGSPVERLPLIQDIIDLQTERNSLDLLTDSRILDKFGVSISCRIATIEVV